MKLELDQLKKKVNESSQYIQDSVMSDPKKSLLNKDIKMDCILPCFTIDSLDQRK